MNRLAFLALGGVACWMVGSGCAKPAEQPPVQPAASGASGQADNAPPQESKEAAVKRAMQEVNPAGKVTLPKNMVPLPKGTEGYTAAKTGPEKTAAEFEASLTRLKGVEAQLTTSVAYKGGVGKNVSLAAIRDPSQFRVQYVKFLDKPVPSLTRETIVSNGTQFERLSSDEEVTSRLPLQTLGSMDTSSLDSWTTEFPRLLFTTLVGGHPITHLVQEAEKAGFDVTSEDRTVPVGQKVVSQRRLIITRKKADAAKGVFDIEIVADQKILLPYTIRINVEAPNKDPLRVMWSAKWLNEQAFPDSTFILPPKQVRTKNKVASTKKA